MNPWIHNCFFYAIFLVFNFFITNKAIIRSTGKITAAKTPRLISSFKISVATPTIVGPNEQPKSPARARKANIAVPPLGKVSEARENAPGHITPTEKPHIAQPNNENAGFPEKDAIT